MNRFATNAADLGTGLTKSASAMNAAGVDMQHTLAMLTGITEITQNSSEAGNALKVFSMRIRGKHFMPIFDENQKLCCA